MGADSPAVVELKQLFTLAEAYGLKEWLVLDLGVVRPTPHTPTRLYETCALYADTPPTRNPPSPPCIASLQVRGLAYYTGTVFEGFDRTGELRAIFGGGRYDKLLSTFIPPLAALPS